MVLLVSLLINTGGCTSVSAPIIPIVLTYGGAVVLAVALITADLDEPEYKEGSAWFVEPNEPNIMDLVLGGKEKTLSRINSRM